MLLRRCLLEAFRRCAVPVNTTLAGIDPMLVVAAFSFFGAVAFALGYIWGRP